MEFWIDQNINFGEPKMFLVRPIVVFSAKKMKKFVPKIKRKTKPKNISSNQFNLF
jgi:hypothetical protein